MSFGEYSAYDPIALAELVRRREMSAHELLEAAIERVEQHNPRLNAVIDRLYDGARQQIDRGLPGGPFAGVPFLLKDDLELEGTHVTFGSVVAREYVCTTTHKVVRESCPARGRKPCAGVQSERSDLVGDRPQGVNRRPPRAEPGSIKRCPNGAPTAGHGDHDARAR